MAELFLVLFIASLTVWAIQEIRILSYFEREDADDNEQ